MNNQLDSDSSFPLPLVPSHLATKLQATEVLEERGQGENSEICPILRRVSWRRGTKRESPFWRNFPDCVFIFISLIRTSFEFNWLVINYLRKLTKKIDRSERPLRSILPREVPKQRQLSSGSISKNFNISKVLQCCRMLDQFEGDEKASWFIFM